MLSPVKIWRSHKKIHKTLGERGKIVTYSKVMAPPSGFESQAPYVVALVRLDNGIRVTSQLVEWEESDLRPGRRVIAILRKTRDPGGEGVIPYGVKFKPA